MNKNTYNLFLVMSLLISGGLFFVIMRAIENETIQQFDLPIIAFVQGLESDWLTIILKTFTWIGSGYGVVPITLIICYILFFKLDERFEAYLVAFTMVSTILLNEGLKRIFTRDRPELYRLMDAGGYSFPSGHTMMAVSLYAIIVFVAWRHITSRMGRFFLLIVSFLTAFLIAVSRIYVGVHFPSDIAGGFFMSSLLLTLIMLVYSRIRGWTM